MCLIRHAIVLFYSLTEYGLVFCLCGFAIISSSLFVASRAHTQMYTCSIQSDDLYALVKYLSK